MLRSPGWPGTASKRPRGSSSRSRTASRREPLRARRPRPELDLAAQLGERAPAVEAVDLQARGRSGGVIGPGAAARAGQRGQQDAQQHRSQSFDVTASSRWAKRSRAASRRVGTCSDGTPSSGAS